MMSDETDRGAILLVEDPFVRNFMRFVLQRDAYQVIEAETCSAQRIIESGMPNVAIVITNVPDSFEAYRDRLKVLYVAACPDPDIAQRFPCCRVLRKPFHPRELVSALRELEQREIS